MTPPSIRANDWVNQVAPPRVGRPSIDPTGPGVDRAYRPTQRQTITRRSRNLGVGWTNETEQAHLPSGTSYLRIREPARPDVVGGLRSVRLELARARRINASNDYRVALFVGGRRVLERVGDVLDDLDREGTATVHLAEPLTD